MSAASREQQPIIVIAPEWDNEATRAALTEAGYLVVAIEPGALQVLQPFPLVALSAINRTALETIIRNPSTHSDFGKAVAKALFDIGRGV